MKPVCCDTSFLYSAYAADNHTPRAVRRLNSLRSPLTISILNQFELENAFRGASHRGLVTREQEEFLLSSFEADCRDERIAVVPIDFPKAVAEARRLSRLYTAAGGHRAFDILLVAVALGLGAAEFCSFDVRQRALAKAAGLTLNP